MGQINIIKADIEKRINTINTVTYNENDEQYQYQSETVRCD